MLSLVVSRASAALVLFIGLSGVACAQIPDDVGISIPSEFVVFKPKSGGAQMSFQGWVIYFTPSNPNLKLKATGTANFYLSSDGTKDEGDLLITSKKVKAKNFIPKILKIKANLTQADKGKFIIAEVISEQDQFAANNVVTRQILATDFP